MSTNSPILITGAAGRVGGVGGLIARILLGHKVPVRAFVRREDERAEELRRDGAAIFVGDLTRPEEVARALEPCRRIYFGMSVSSAYLEAAIAMAAVAREQGTVEALVHMSQMTVSQMSLRSMTSSPQQRQHWLAEQALNWSGLPIVHVRPTVFKRTFSFLIGLPSKSAAMARSGFLSVRGAHRRLPRRMWPKWLRPFSLVPLPISARPMS